MYQQVCVNLDFTVSPFLYSQCLKQDAFICEVYVMDICDPSRPVAEAGGCRL